MTDTETHTTKTSRRWPIILFLGILAVLALIQATLLLAAGWLNAAPGQRWLQAKLSAATGMHVLLDQFTIAGISELAVKHAEIADASGPLAKIDHLKINVHLAALLTRHLGITIDAKKIELLRLPAATAKTPKNPARPYLLFHHPKYLSTQRPFLSPPINFYWTPPSPAGP